MLLAKKVRLIIPKELQSKFFQSVGASRFAYNWSINNDDNLSIKESELRKMFTQYKKEECNQWMKEVNNNIFKQAIIDYIRARANFKSKKAKAKPRIKKKGKCRESFYVDTEQIKLLINNKVQIPSIGVVRYVGYNLPLYERKVKNKKIYHIGIKPVNPRISFDGKYWYLSVSYEETERYIKTNKNLSIGVDLGLKRFATICINDSTKNEKDFYEVTSLKSKYKKLAKRKKHLDRKISKRVLEIKRKIKKEGVSVTKSNNYLKLLQKRLKYNHKMTNIKKDDIYKTISFMVKSKPDKIVIEDLNVKGMMKNKRLAKWISFNQFYNFRKILEYKCKFYGINLIIANRFYSSSKTCSCCGNKKEKLSLSERTYVCDKCGLVIDRDENAALNLSNYC